MRQSLDERYPAAASITQLAIGTKRSHDNGIPDMHDDDTRWPDERQAEFVFADGRQRKLFTMPVSSDNRRKAASKKTYRSVRAGRKVAKVIGGKHKRRLRRMD